MKYKKLSIEVDAVQYNNLNLKEIEIFVGKKLYQELENETEYLAGKGAPIFSISIETKEGTMKAMPNDWIIKEPFPTGDRNFYPCKNSIFKNTYKHVLSVSKQKEVLELSAKMWSKFMEIPEDEKHSDDINDFRFHIHAIQNILFTQEYKKKDF